jgi:threonine dehydratase
MVCEADYCMLTLAALNEIQTQLALKLHRTPLISTHQIGHRLEYQVDLLLKAEHMQKTGSFKPRGILNRLATLTPEQRQHGVITVSTGNTAQALAWAASQAHIPCTVIMPTVGTAQVKIDAARDYGANVCRAGENMAASMEYAQGLSAERKLTLIHAYDDPLLIAGHATVGLEILQDCPQVDTILVPVGGGALAAGVAAAVKLQRPSVAVYGVEPEFAPKLTRALAVGCPVNIDSTQTMADGLRTPSVGQHTFPYLKEYLDGVILVSEASIRQAMLLLLSRAKCLVEPAGAITVGALLEKRVPLRENSTVVAVLSGGNCDLAQLTAIQQAEQIVKEAIV